MENVEWRIKEHSRALKKGFTIIELLVASLLLGVLVTILTMVFNQSSIAWRIGTAGVADMDRVRDKIAQLRDEADNAFVWKGKVYRHVGLWDQDGELRDRACDAPGSNTESEKGCKALILRSNLSTSGEVMPEDFDPMNVGQMRNPGNAKTYTVNVKSAGPDRVFDTYDDIWSWPDDFE